MKSFLKFATLLVACFISFASLAQDTGIRSKIFLPSLEIGYVGYSAKALSPGIMIKTAIEYRFKTQNAAFIRLNYDTRDAEFKIVPNGLTNVIEGKLKFSDLVTGIGYRRGSKKVQFIGLLQGGISFYNVPSFETQNNVLLLRNTNKNTPVSRVTLGVEYYLDANSAITLEFFQSQVWGEDELWADSNSAWGVSLGVTATLY
jgi:hypothetical protein